MRVFLTGGSGYLGGRLLRRLLERGHRVRALARRPLAEMERLEPVPGDLEDADALRRGMEGVDAVLHFAGLVRMYAPRRAFERVNVEGTRRVLALAREAGAPVLYASSFTALGPGARAPRDEETDAARDRFCTPYEWSKYRADQIARSVLEAGELPLTIIYPGVMYGPGAPTQGNLVSGVIADFLRGRIPGLLGDGSRAWCYTFVDDLLDGVEAILARGAWGRRFILGGENASAREFFALLSELTGRPAPARRVPYFLATGLGGLEWLGAVLLRRPPRLFTPGIVETYKHHWTFSSARAERDLDYAVTPLREGLRPTVAAVCETLGLAVPALCVQAGGPGEGQP